MDVKFEKGEITVKGSIDEKKIHKQIEKLSKRKVEILPAPAKGKEIVVEKTVKETKQVNYLYISCSYEHNLLAKHMQFLFYFSPKISHLLNLLKFHSS